MKDRNGKKFNQPKRRRRINKQSENIGRAEKGSTSDSQESPRPCSPREIETLALEDAIQMAEQYRGAARRVHKNDNNYTLSIVFYEKAIAILTDADNSGALTSSKYFAKMLFCYGISLSNAGRHEEAQRQFAEADRLGYTHFMHDLADELTVVRQTNPAKSSED